MNQFPSLASFDPKVDGQITGFDQVDSCTLAGRTPKIADFYEEEVDVAVAGLVSLLEPVMIFFLGTVIGGIVIAMYLPIFGLIQNL